MRMVTAVRSLVLAAAAALIPAASYAGIFVSVGFGAPPPLPVYVQPELPAPGYIWTPGYWSYDEDGGYYWVPGAWVLAPYPGALWTPGYWAYGDGGYGWNAGYWGLHIGFYGGVNYGCGYFGHGFEGGYWDQDRYFYNRSVTNITNVNVTNVYNNTVINNYNNNVHTSFVGGNGGLQVRPTPQELNYSREQHVAPLPAQRQNEQRAVQSRQQFVALNHGQPPVVARTQPVVFNRTAALTPVNRGTTNLPVNRGTMQPLRAPAANNGVRASLPTANPAGNGQRPLITAHPVNAAPVNSAPINAGRVQNRTAPPNTQTYNRPQQPVFNQPRTSNSGANGYPARNQQPVYSRPQQAPVYQQRPSNPAGGYPERPQQTYNRPQAPVFNQRPVEAPQYHQPAQPQYRPQPEPRQQAQSQYRSQPEPRQQAQPQYRQPAPQQQSRPQEFHGAPAGGHGGHGGR